VEGRSTCKRKRAQEDRGGHKRIEEEQKRIEDGQKKIREGIKGRPRLEEVLKSHVLLADIVLVLVDHIRACERKQGHAVACKLSI
jgi:hypothetical protein